MHASTWRAGHGRRPLRLAAVLLALVATITLAGCGSGDEGAGKSAANAAPAAAKGMPRSEPTWVKVPSIDANSSLVPLGLNKDKTVEIPPVSQPLQAGWYKYSPTPGQLGPSVILGHIDGNHKKGIFWRLHEVKKGAKVLIGRKDGSVATFIVNKIKQIPKTSFPSDEVYGNTPDSQVRLITCGGEFDASKRSYKDNTIVYGQLQQ
ncbi:class F sortase [Sciscionella sediminilitoris]|uniref:class F sortase n=1 Tax=Sciscionella sediminilitoris TaxID=1445613 RepID=UPI00068CEE44|nr:class F sortase [Sciscionella sp. SE31]